MVVICGKCPIELERAFKWGDQGLVSRALGQLSLQEYRYRRNEEYCGQYREKTPDRETGQRWPAGLICM